MKSTELRIGNIIKIKNPILKDLIDEGFQKIYTDRTTVIYVGYDYLGVIIDNSEVEIMLQDVEPIPLTEEWLLKFGFEKKPMYGKHNRYFFIKNKLYYCQHDFYSFVYSNNSLEIKEPKYVHQLQNLYFALTGEELTLKQK